MGPQEDYVETVFTCEGDINDPNLQTRLEDFKRGLRDLLSTDKRKLILKKVEPWNSVRVTFNIPLEAARRLKQLAQQGNTSLRQLGVLAVQLEGDQLISLTIAGRNNERTQLIFKTANETVDASATSLSVINSNLHGPLSGAGVTDYGSPGTNSIGATQKNIADYLRQGSSILDSLFPSQQNSASDIHRTPNVTTSICDSLPSNSVFVSSANISPTQSSSICGPIPGHVSGQVSLGFPQTTSDISSTSGNPGHSKLMTAGFPYGIPQSQPNIQLGLPPPPPYPMGSALLNSISKSGRVGLPTTSPLLVNLLQTDPHLAGLNFVNSKMLPPAEASPPTKKKRRPRKPKEKNKQTLSSPPDGEISIQSVPNPGLDSCGLPLVTSGGSSNMPTIPMVTQALPASTQPAVTYTTTQGKQPSLVSNNSTNISNTDHFSVAKQQYQDLVTSSGRHVENSGDQFLAESTAGKIINPYTGLLEPMENSDSSPCKSDSSLDGSSPRKKHTKHSPKERKSSSGCVANNPTGSAGVISSDSGSSVSNSVLEVIDSVARGHLSVDNHVRPVSTSPHSEQTVSNKTLHSSQDFQTSVSTYASKEKVILDNPKHGNMLESDLKNISRTPVPTSIHTKERVHLHHSKFVSNVTDMDLSLSNVSGKVSVNDKQITTNQQANIHSAHHVGYAKPGQQLPPNHQHPALARVGKDNSKVLSDNVSPTTDPEQLLNMPHLHTSKNPHIGSLIIDSPGGDSENSSQSSLLHDPHMQNDIGAVSSVCTIETKSLNHDSGVGSSSERSDDTPSEPGDTDFKSGHGVEDNLRLLDSGVKGINQTESKSKGLNDGFMKVNCEQNGKSVSQRYNNSGSGVQSIVTQQSMDFTVGYAIADSINIQQQEKKMGTDISTIMAVDKVLNHPAFNNINSKSQKRDNLGKDNSLTVLHWSTTDKFLCNQMESKQKTSNKYIKDGAMSSQNCFPQAPLSQRNMQHTALSLKNADVLQPTNSQNPASSGSDIYSSEYARCQSISASQYGNMLQNCKDSNRLSPCSQNPSDTLVPSSHLPNNYSSSNIRDRNLLCNTVNSSQCMSVADTNSSMNMSVSSEQLKQRKYSKSPHSDFKSKSPISAVIRTSSYDNVMMSMSSALEKRNDLHVTQGFEGSMMNTGSAVPKVESGNKPPNNSNNLDVAKTANVTSMYKRRSPAGSMLNSLPQHFFNPALPLAKSLTESVQKLVKPLPSIDASSLPHQQRKSPVSTASKSMAATSPPRLGKNTGGNKSPCADSKISRPGLPSSSASVISGHDPSDITNSLHVLNDNNTSSQGIENLILPILSKTAELPILDLESSHGLDFGSLQEAMNTHAENHEHEEINQNKSNNFVESLVTSSSSTMDISNDSKVNFPVSKDSSETSIVNTNVHCNPKVDTFFKFEVKQSPGNQSDQVPEELKSTSNCGTFLSQIDLSALAVSQSSHSPTSREIYSVQKATKMAESVVNIHSKTHLLQQVKEEKSVQLSEPVNLIDKNDCNTGNGALELNSNGDVKRPDQKDISTAVKNETDVHQEKKLPILDHGGDNNKNTMKLIGYEEAKFTSTTQKLNANFSDVKKHVSSVDLSIKPEKVDLEDKKVEVTVVTKPKHLNADSKSQDKSEPTVPPIILRVRRKSISEPSESSEESHSTMTLRGRTNNKGIDTATVEVSVNSQPASKLQKATRSRSSPNEIVEKLEKPDQSKSSVVEDDSTKRNLRRRKNTQDMELEAKKSCLDSDEVARHTRSSDIKDQNINDNTVKQKVNETKEVNAVSVSKMETNKVNDCVINQDSADTILPENVKSGLRARDKNKTTVPEDKVKCAPKEIKEVKKMKAEEDINSKNRQASKRNRLSPTFPADKAQVINSRDKSPVRGNRTRGQISPNLEQDDGNKRSTRSTKTKDATDTLPPSSKRRRTTSRDHR